MGTRYRVGKSYVSGCLIVPLVIAAALGVVAALASDPGVPLLVIFGLPCLLIGAGFGVSIYLNRRFVEIEPDGFVFTDRRGPRRIRDEDVDSMGFHIERKYKDGLPNSVTYHVRIWAGGTEGPMRVEHDAALEGMDGLETWLERLRERLLGRAKADLAAGRTISSGGPGGGTGGAGGGARGGGSEIGGWAFGRGELSLEVGGSETRLLLEDIYAVDMFDETVCIWKTGDEEPTARFPVGERSAWLLLAVLPEMLPERPDEEAPPEGSLGRVLFERSEESALGPFLRVAGIALVGGAVVAIWLALGGWTEVSAAGLVGMSAVALGLGAAAVRYGFAKKLMKRSFRCQDWGVSRLRWNKVHRLRYREVTSFTYGATRVFVNGSYSHTDVTLRFVGAGEAGPEEIDYTTSAGAADTELGNLRDHISGVIAGRMAGELAEGREVEWLSNLVLLPDGLRYTTVGMLGAKEPVVIPFTEVTGFDVEQGTFRLWRAGEEGAAVQEDFSQPNFFPGYVLLQRLFAQDDDGDGEGNGADEGVGEGMTSEQE